MKSKRTTKREEEKKEEARFWAESYVDYFFADVARAVWIDDNGILDSQSLALLKALKGRNWSEVIGQMELDRWDREFHYKHMAMPANVEKISAKLAFVDDLEPLALLQHIIAVLCGCNLVDLQFGIRGYD